MVTFFGLHELITISTLNCYVLFIHVVSLWSWVFNGRKQGPLVPSDSKVWEVVLSSAGTEVLGCKYLQVVRT